VSPRPGLFIIASSPRTCDGIATLITLDANAIPGRQSGTILEHDLKKHDLTKMTEISDKRSDSTREQILRAAAHQFAQRPYYAVGLDDILAEAQLTKGAMYFHFRSKHALALAIVDEQTAKAGAAVQELLTRKLSGLETLIDVSYLIAMADITENVTRAAFNLLESVGRTEKLQERLLGGWIQLIGDIAARGIREGDIVDRGDPEDIGRLLVSIYMGMRQASQLDDPVVLLGDYEKALSTVLRGIVQPDKIDYFAQFLKRRTALAIKAASAMEISG
jgi:TetR/AcrR family transcriptional repressor of nem operon